MTQGVNLALVTLFAGEAMPHDVVSLTRALIQFDTINPPGQEAACAQFLQKILDEGGFATKLHWLAPERASLEAWLGAEAKLPLCLTGHLDVVPLGSVPWEHPPLEGVIHGGRIHGRGSTDMKGGLAAMVVAALAHAQKHGPQSSLRLVITACEEMACSGAEKMAREKALPPAGALLVCEPTANQPVIGHKGVIWLKALAQGVAAHGSTPHLGDNAIFKLMRGLSKLENFDFAWPAHPHFRPPSLNLGKIQGGAAFNMVPDRAEAALDLRTLPDQSHEQLMQDLQELLGPDILLECQTQSQGFFTSPDHPWLQRVLGILPGVLGGPPSLSTGDYVTDAAFLTPALGHCPTLILGPGDIALAHKVNESCEIAQLHQAVEIYQRIMQDWVEKAI